MKSKRSVSAVVSPSGWLVEFKKYLTVYTSLVAAPPLSLNVHHTAHKNCFDKNRPWLNPFSVLFTKHLASYSGPGMFCEGRKLERDQTYFE